MAAYYIINPANPEVKQLVHASRRRYAVHLGDHFFFAFMDGHWSNVEITNRPSTTEDIHEAIRMLDYANDDGRWPNASIVIISEIVMESISGAALDHDVRQTALAKLTEREKIALGIK